MKRNDPTMAPRASAQGADRAAERGDEPLPAPPPLSQRAPVPAAAGAGEITIIQQIAIAPVEPERSDDPLARSGRGAQRLAKHTLVLIGELDRGSTHTLEAEIERLCEAGVAAITLDLTKLSGIDSSGVAVIAFRSGWCRRRGHDLALIPGPRAVQRAFERAGVAQALRFTNAEADAEN
jgi:anti-anti-sigma factor